MHSCLTPESREVRHRPLAKVPVRTRFWISRPEIMPFRPKAEGVSDTRSVMGCMHLSSHAYLRPPWREIIPFTPEPFSGVAVEL